LIAATEMPLSRQPWIRPALAYSLLPFRNPPPWMKTTSGVGESDFAFHRSRI
jgi:hypothetical protein